MAFERSIRLHPNSRTRSGLAYLPETASDDDQHYLPVLRLLSFDEGTFPSRGWRERMQIQATSHVRGCLSEPDRESTLNRALTVCTKDRRIQTQKYEVISTLYTPALSS